MRKLLLGVAASALLATGALAADPVDTVQPTFSSAGFDWDGFYVGLGVTGGQWSNTESFGLVDIIAGVNVTAGDVLFGGEAWIGGYGTSFGFTGVEGGLEGRLGYLVSPEALIYLSGGGQFFDAGGQYGTVGAGVEFAVTDNVSLDLEYKYWGVSNNGFTAHSIGASANFHF
ncbi:MAG TPA: porin family protein [Devosia sp.]|nr:porin family protein [Devosia sp.]